MTYRTLKKNNSACIGVVIDPFFKFSFFLLLRWRRAASLAFIPLQGCIKAKISAIWLYLSFASSIHAVVSTLCHLTVAICCSMAFFLFLKRASCSGEHVAVGYWGFAGPIPSFSLEPCDFYLLLLIPRSFWALLELELRQSPSVWSKR